MKTRNRLIGIWKSDRKQTLRLFHPYHQLPSVKRRKMASIFGKLTLRYTPTYVYSTLNGVTTRERYRVVAEDQESVVVKSYQDQYKKRLGPILGEGWDFSPKLVQLRFDRINGKECYWILAGKLCECFRRIK